MQHIVDTVFSTLLARSLLVAVVDKAGLAAQDQFSAAPFAAPHVQFLPLRHV